MERKRSEQRGVAAAPKGKARAPRRRRSAQPQRYLKAKHARHGDGALRSPRLMIFLLCVTSASGGIEVLRWPHGGHGDCASARAGYGVRWWAWPADARAPDLLRCIARDGERKEGVVVSRNF